MSRLVSSAGSRGRVWACVDCNYKGERHAVRKHIFERHMAVTEYPYECPACSYAHYRYATFVKHTRWYGVHLAVVQRTGQPVTLQAEKDVRPESQRHLQMMRQLSIEDSQEYWTSRSRAVLQRSQQHRVTASWPSISCVAVSSLSRPVSSLVSSSPSLVPTVSTSLASVPSLLAPALPKSPSLEDNQPATPTPAFSAEEQALIDEFLVPADSIELCVSEEEVEALEPRTCDASTNTSPMKDNVAELRAIIRQQRRALEENTTAIHTMRKLLEERGLELPEDNSTRRIHHGTGNGEAPNVTCRRRTPPPQRLQSVVYMPARPRPQRQPRKIFHRPSPLERLFEPDQPRRCSRSPVKKRNRR